MAYIQWAYQLSDQVLGATLKKMTDNDLLFLVSDHGMEPVHTMIAPNRELEKAGLLKRNKDGEVDVTKSKAYAVASGAIAHIYINLQDRERKGIVSKEEYPEVQKEVMEIFTGLEVNEVSRIKKFHHLLDQWRHNDSLDNVWSMSKKFLNILFQAKENPFEGVVEKDSEGAGMLQHEQAGDVLLIAKQGYYMAQDEASTAQQAIDRGNHGGNPERMELRPVLFVTGGNYPTTTIIEELSTLDIAPTLYALLNLRAPDWIDGKVIDPIIESNSQ